MSKIAPLDWLLVYRTAAAPIGAVGFIDTDAVAIVSFDDDYTAPKGQSSAGHAVTQVALQARRESAVIFRDAGFQSIATRLFADFERNVPLNGLYGAYFQRGVSMTGRGVSQLVSGNMVKRLALKKSGGSAINEALRAATQG